MDFHRMRDVYLLPGILSIFEGIITLKNISFPHTILAITSFLFQTPHASPTFLFTSLPILIHLAHTQHPFRFLLTAIPSLGIPLTANGLLTSWNLLPSPGQVIGGQTILSTVIAGMCALAVLLHRLSVGWGGFKEGNWDTTMAFGLIWAGAWLAFSWMSPLGRYGIPSPFPSDVHVLARVHETLGTTGVDLICGSAAYSVYCTGKSLWDHRDFITSGSKSPTDNTPVIPPRGNDTSARISSIHSSRSSRESIDTDSTLNSTILPLFNTPIGSHSDSSTVPTSLSSSSQRETSIKKSIIALAGIGSILSTNFLSPNLSSTSDSIDIQTPFGLGLVLPRSQTWRLNDLIYEARVIGNRANLLVFPESAFVAHDQWDRQYAIDTVVREVCQQYGIWVQMGIDTTVDEYPFLSDNFADIGNVNLSTIVRRDAKKVNEVVFMGPEGEIGVYAKQMLIPYVESFPFHKGLMPVPTWTIDLPPPPGMNKTDWTQKAPYTRPIMISPLICLDIFHPDLLSASHQLPDLYTVSASALTAKIAEHIIGQAESLAISQSTPVVVVAGSRGRMNQGISTILDAWGRKLVEQRGGRSVIYQVSIPYLTQGQTRGGGWKVGSKSLLGAGIAILAFVIFKKHIPRSARTDAFQMKVFKFFGGDTDGWGGEGSIAIPPDPDTPPPKYRYGEDRVRRSEMMRKSPPWGRGGTRSGEDGIHNV